MDSPAFCCNLVGKLASAIGRVVIHHHYFNLRRMAHQPVDYDRQILLLIVSRNNDESLLAHARSERTRMNYESDHEKTRREFQNGKIRTVNYFSDSGSREWAVIAATALRAGAWDAPLRRDQAIRRGFGNMYFPHPPNLRRHRD